MAYKSPGAPTYKADVAGLVRVIAVEVQPGAVLHSAYGSKRKWFDLDGGTHRALAYWLEGITFAPAWIGRSRKS